jgi:Icc-related predicted phosphoesterase
MKNRGDDIKAMWDLIPDDTDILITHGPPYDMLDECLYSSKANKGNHAGCEELLKAICRIKPKLHVFGHIHESHGVKTIQWDGTDKKTTFVNACIMDIHYYPKNPVISVEI